jgi:hypothetical protein
MMQVSQIHSLVSQHHQHGKLGPERISNELLDLAAAVKQIAEQYTADPPLWWAAGNGHK